MPIKKAIFPMEASSKEAAGTLGIHKRVPVPLGLPGVPKRYL